METHPSRERAVKLRMTSDDMRRRESEEAEKKAGHLIVSGKRKLKNFSNLITRSESGASGVLTVDNTDIHSTKQNRVLAIIPELADSAIRVQMQGNDSQLLRTDCPWTE